MVRLTPNPTMWGGWVDCGCRAAVRFKVSGVTTVWVLKFKARVEGCRWGLELKVSWFRISDLVVAGL